MDVVALLGTVAGETLNLLPARVQLVKKEEAQGEGGRKGGRCRVLQTLSWVGACLHGTASISRTLGKNLQENSPF